ncbi:MAG TPA: inositol monophosphatase family protein [Leifsonia sp.]|nr:inositol monophosphatase family protein [Leifsonia sp.]
MPRDQEWRLGELLGLATHTAMSAGGLLMERFGDVSHIETKAGSGDVVTEVDRASESLIIQQLRDARPHDGVIAEESGASAGSTGLTWVVDPLDGSANYIHGATPFAVSIAVCDAIEGRRLSPLAGVVFDPVHGELFCAARGMGATLNGAALQRRQGRALDGALIGTGLAHTQPLRRAQLSVLGRLLPHVGDLRRSGAGAVDLCWVAVGRIEAFFQPGLKIWDFAAAQLIVTESGAGFGLASGLEGSTETVIATAPEIETEFLAALYASGIAPLLPTSADQTGRRE